MITEGMKVLVLKSRKLGNMVEGVAISDERDFGNGIVASWSVKVQSGEKISWVKSSNLKAIN